MTLVSAPRGKDPIVVELREGVLSLTLARPKGNILDSAMITALREALSQHGRNPDLKAILLTGEREDFSWGASVQEHEPDHAPAMLALLHGLFRDLLTLDVPCVAAVRGQCLGGSLELVLCASFLFGAPNARFGLPEIKLGVFAPFASAILPLKVGQAHAERLLLTGESIDAQRAYAIGLLDEITEDPQARARAFIEQVLLPKSASSLRFALRAARGRLTSQLDERLFGLERLYLGELMATHDAQEGITAFIQKRPPRWQSR